MRYEDTYYVFESKCMRCCLPPAYSIIIINQQNEYDTIAGDVQGCTMWIAWAACEMNTINKHHLCLR